MSKSLSLRQFMLTLIMRRLLLQQTNNLYLRSSKTISILNSTHPNLLIVKIFTFRQLQSWIKSSSLIIKPMLLFVWIIFTLLNKLSHSRKLIKSKLILSLYIIIITKLKSHILVPINSLHLLFNLFNLDFLTLNISDGLAIL